MYPNYYLGPFGQEVYYDSNYYPEEYYYDNTFDERFGQFLPPFGGGPGGGPMGSPPFTPGAPGQGPQAGPPTAPPPSFVPAQTQQAGTFAVDPGGIRRCMFRYTYVWLRNGRQFWFYPTFVGRNSVSGYRWTGFRWVYFGISLRQIQSFTCF